MRTSIFAAFLISTWLAAPAGAQQITKDSVPGVTNFARLETTVACGGVIKTSAVTELKQMGFKSIFDLQLPTETGADVDGEAAAAKTAGLNFVHVPFTPASPDTSSVDEDHGSVAVGWKEYFTPAVSGTYYLSVMATVSSQPYTVTVSN